MRLSIVILNWNGSAYLQKFMPALLRHTPLPDVEVVVADNGSADGSLDMLARRFPQVKTISLEHNYGFAEGYNKALFRMDGSEYYLLLNSDVEVCEGWLEPMLGFMDAHPEVAACQPKVRSCLRRDCFEYAGASGGFIDRLGYPFCRGRVLGTLERDTGQYDDVADVFWATGACLLVRAEAYWEAGGLDGGFFAHMEEIDLCWRLHSRGHRVVCVPQSVVYHVGGGTLDAESPYKTYLNYRNNLLMLYKNLPEADLRRVMFVRYFLDYLSALHLLLAGRFRNAFQVFKARHDYKKLRPKYYSKRCENLQRSVVSGAVPGMYSKSLLLQYYLHRKRTYSKLVR